MDTNGFIIDTQESESFLLICFFFVLTPVGHKYMYAHGMYTYMYHIVFCESIHMAVFQLT